MSDEFDWRSLKGPVIGVDEVGRGCLAGPVLAGACWLSPTDPDLDEYTDSKLLSEVRRENLATKILRHHRVSTAFADLEEIAELNILWASMLAMRRAIETLCASFHFQTAIVLVDGNQKIPDLGARFRQILLVEGDRRAKPISAASIVAKVERDQFMKELHERFPQYDFASNKGYGSAKHRKAIEDWGPSPWHRRDFSGVREHWHRLTRELATDPRATGGAASLRTLGADARSESSPLPVAHPLRRSGPPAANEEPSWRTRGRRNQKPSA